MSSPQLPTARAQPAGPRSVWDIGQRGAFVMSSLGAGSGVIQLGSQLATLLPRRSHVGGVATAVQAAFPVAAPSFGAEQLKSFALNLRADQSSWRFPHAVFAGDD